MSRPDGYLRAVAATGRGLVRPTNQDALLVFEWLSQAANPRVVELRTDLPAAVPCALADGLGGHVAGDLASRVGLAFLSTMLDGWADTDAVRRGLVALSDAVHETGRRSPETSGMRTTIAGLLLLPGAAICFNVGDSRVYRIVDGYLEQISIDDTPPGSGVLTQALGDPPANPIAPHVSAVPLPPEGARFLLCSDGVYAPIGPAEFRRLCREPQPHALVRGLLDAAYRAGAPDNVSLIALEVGAPTA